MRLINQLVILFSLGAMSPSVAAQSLDLKRVTLSSSGVGYFEYEALVERDATLRLPVKLDQVDDVLKSLVVYDSKGSVAGISLPGREPMAELLRQLPFDAAALNSMPELLQALRGAQLIVKTNASEIRGRIVSVESFNPQNTSASQAANASKDASALHRVALMTSGGIQHFVLEQARSWQFADVALRAQVENALASIAANRARDGRTIEIVTKGSEKRTIRVAYVTSAPIWKSAYRLTIPTQGNTKGQLQGWAVVENLSGQDWKNIELTLTSGKPVAFSQNLYTSYFNQRPEVAVEMPNRIVPRADTGTFAEKAEFPAAARMDSLPRPSFAPAPAPAPALAAPRAMAPSFAAPAPVMSAPAGFAQASDVPQTQDQDTQMSYKFALPVTVGSGRSLSVPIIAATLPMERVAQLQLQVSNQNPLAAVQITNDSTNSLPPGAVTIYEANDQSNSGGSFLGDSQLAVLPAGDNRILAYALDQKISISSNTRNTSSIVKVGSEKANLLVDNITRVITSFNIKSTQQQAQSVLIEVPKYLEHTLLIASGKLVGETNGRLRISLPTPANSAQGHDVIQERARTSRVALASLSNEALTDYLRNTKDDTTASVIQRVIQLRKDVETNAILVLQASNEINNTTQEQQRLRANLESAEKGGALYKRFAASLSAAEDKIEKSIVQRDAALAAQNAAQARLLAYLASL
jgi:Domain of unknown function (DUF4139)